MKNKKIRVLPSGSHTGAHVIRDDGLILLMTSLERSSRRRAYAMLTDSERGLLHEVAGDDRVAEWLAAEVVTPREVPEALRSPLFNYDHHYWPVPAEGNEALASLYPGEAPPPPG